MEKKISKFSWPFFFYSKDPKLEIYNKKICTENLTGIESLKSNTKEEVKIQISKKDEKSISNVSTILPVNNKPKEISLSSIEDKVAFIPVILSQFTIQLTKTITINLPELLIDLKEAKNRLEIT